MQIDHRTDSLQIATFDRFPKDRLQHGVLTRHGGVGTSFFSSLNLSSSVPDDPAAVDTNRTIAYGAFGRATHTLVHAHLVHEAAVASVTQADHGRVIPGTDGLITNDPGCGLTMNYADCAPILVYDPDRHAIGLGHAGWRGTMADVPGALVRAMVATYGSDPARLIGAVGPCISGVNYEVGEEVIRAAERAFGDRARDVILEMPDKVKRHVDLPAANRLNFERAGVTQVELSGLCTAERTDLFFSHRAEKGKTGRFGVVMVLNT